jgi:3-oxoacyl-[acyl-carrier-protein] synthase-1
MKLFVSEPGIVCALGGNLAEVRGNLFAGCAPGFVETDRYSPGRVLPLGCVTSPLPDLGARPLAERSRNNAMIVAAFAQIEAAFRAASAGIAPERIAVVIGSSTSGIAEGEAAVAVRARCGEWPTGFDYAQQELGAPARFLAALVGAKGPAYSISTACTSGAKALAAAARLVKSGMADLVIAGGADSLCSFTVAGFSALAAVSDERCNPFSANRRGINIGEGAALFLVSAKPDAVRLSGWGESSDAHHISAPDPLGTGALAAVDAALTRAGIAAGDLDYVNFHGTATRQNDAMEATVFAQRCPQVSGSSTKPLTGHALGAAGAIEAAICWLALTDDACRLPPQIWDEARDPELPSLAFVARGECAKAGPRHVLSTSFAFGGNNAALVFSRHD